MNRSWSFYIIFTSSCQTFPPGIICHFMTNGNATYYCFHFEKTGGKVPSIKIRCHTCLCEFTTQRSLKNQVEKEGHQLKDINFYKQGATEPIMLPKREWILQVHHAGYLLFLTGLAELINFFHKPDVSSNWAKIDLVMLLTEFFKQLLVDLGFNKPFSALQYKLCDIDLLAHLFNQTVVPLTERAYFVTMRRCKLQRLLA